MPVILPEDAIGDWVKPDADPGRIVSEALADMDMVVEPYNQSP